MYKDSIQEVWRPQHGWQRSPLGRIAYQTKRARKSAGAPPAPHPPGRQPQTGPTPRQKKARRSEGRPTRTTWAQEGPGRSVSVTRAKGGGREGALRTPRQARVTVAKELSGEKHQAARQMTEHCDLREATKQQQTQTTNTSNKHRPQARGGEGAYAAKRLRQARAFSLCNVIDRRWRSIMAQERSVWSSPIAKAEDLASSDQTPLATLPQPPPTASMTIGMNVIPCAVH